MRLDTGGLEGWETSAGAIVGRLDILLEDLPGVRLLDVGSGAGALPIALRRMKGRFSRGRYVGLDVDPGLVEWCRRRLEDSTYRFAHFDYWNASYNPGGGRFIALPVEDDWAGAVVLNSVFTHMLPDDVAHYVREIGRVMAPDAVALITAFLYDEQSPDLDRFPHEGDGYRFTKAGSPESELGLPAAWLLERFAEAGLKVERRPGHQDLLIARPELGPGR